MIEANPEIRSLPRSRQNATELLQRLEKSGEPIVLTINGKAELVVQDAESYRKLLDLVDRLETLDALREGAADMDAGRTYTTAQIREALRTSNELPR